ncbi:MOSC domain-containing protein [Streptomyces sp. YS415]|uniref:MOSC domain-containing protein n=1 Tax=Streptomyces sp. YS415 TaxID=2944806 RepID=UPI0020211BCD|nr:MOSC N-terminal beta barrel domain-containing protein [Streptomyces sp. YS415]MCL7425692.1 MOSC domain-containing protein [Streptomyces sp. YS415]
MAEVLELVRYPVKGCAGTSVGDTLLTPAGLAHDRSFMVIGEDGVYRTQRRHPRLALIRPALAADGWMPGTSGYADSSAVHLLTRSSLALLDQRLAEPLPMSRFRPNIVVGGDGWAAEPHAEDRARRITIDGAELGYAKLAVRCAVTLVDQETGTRQGKEPLRTLASYRRAAPLTGSGSWAPGPRTAGGRGRPGARCRVRPSRTR